MRFGYTIIYVADVPASLAFFGRAFGVETRYLHDSSDYGELATGDTVLAFAAHSVANALLPQGYVAADQSDRPLGMEVALVTDDVPAAHEKAVAAGAVSLQAPVRQPWGQTVSHLRCPDGLLVELCSPVPSSP
ncbi:VOC family protein [Novispirillum itersonii]|uniref:VOC family protein n=1 Tax=Novispirillum itersonii TaxID=189 RepID=UPI00036763B2|nr:VOC family protein [Novispirillum itersonii]